MNQLEGRNRKHHWKPSDSIKVYITQNMQNVAHNEFADQKWAETQGPGDLSGLQMFQRYIEKVGISTIRSHLFMVLVTQG